MNPLKKQVEAMTAVLEQEHETYADAAKAAISLAWSQYEDRSAWAVVGWMEWDEELPDWERPADSYLVIGGFVTETEARNAAGEFRKNKNWRCFVAPMWYGTPFVYFKERNAEDLRRAKKDGLSEFEAALERRRAWFEANPQSELPYDIDDDTERCTKCGQTVGESAEREFRLIPASELEPGDKIVLDGWLHRTVRAVRLDSGGQTACAYVTFEPALSGAIRLPWAKPIQLVERGV